jgi:hypothetical protein
VFREVIKNLTEPGLGLSFPMSGRMDVIQWSSPIEEEIIDRFAAGIG